jgi:hypothetical protein
MCAVTAIHVLFGCYLYGTTRSYRSHTVLIRWELSLLCHAQSHTGYSFWVLVFVALYHKQIGGGTKVNVTIHPSTIEPFDGIRVY